MAAKIEEFRERILKGIDNVDWREGASCVLDALAPEIARLEAENKRLKAENKRLKAALREKSYNHEWQVCENNRMIF